MITTDLIVKHTCKLSICTYITLIILALSFNFKYGNIKIQDFKKRDFRVRTGRYSVNEDKNDLLDDYANREFEKSGLSLRQHEIKQVSLIYNIKDANNVMK